MRYLLTLCALLLVAACGTNKPVVDFDKSADFKSYRSFAFISEHPLLIDESVPGLSPLLEGRLKQITENVLSDRGFERVTERQKADFVVGFTVGSREKIRVSSFPDSYRPYYDRWGWGGPYYGHSNVDVHQYTEGTLAVDIYEVKSRKPVWHGASSRQITTKMRENPGVALREVLGDLLAKFPPAR